MSEEAKYYFSLTNYRLDYDQAVRQIAKDEVKDLKDGSDYYEFEGNSFNNVYAFLVVFVFCFLFWFFLLGFLYHAQLKLYKKDRF